MAELKLDTLKFANELEGAGLTRQQAAVCTDALARTFFEAGHTLTTKDDLEILRISIKNDLLAEATKLQVELERAQAENERSRSRLLDQLDRRGKVLNVIQIATVIGALVALLHAFK